jgi:hypothetical protein
MSGGAAGQRASGARRYGRAWLLLLALLLLALPFGVPVSLSVGRWTQFVDTARPPAGQ